MVDTNHSLFDCAVQWIILYFVVCMIASCFKR